MTLEIEIPDSMRGSLPTEMPELSRLALEGFAVEGYRKRLLTAFQVRQILGHGSRMETMNFLGDHGVYPNYKDEKVLEDIRKLNEFLDA